MSNIQLAPWQLPVFNFLTQTPFAAVWMGVGTGKTLTTLAALQAIQPTGHILVIAPLAIARSTWLDEIDKWGFNVRTKSLIVDDKDRKLSRKARLEGFTQTLSDPPTMYFINRELLTLPARKSCTVCGGVGGKALGQHSCPSCQGGLIDQLPDVNGIPVWPFATVVIDEAQGFKSHASARFKALKTVRPQISRMIQLSGTPAPNGLHDLWSQIYLLDQGRALEQNISRFRKRWFTSRDIVTESGDKVPVSYQPIPGAQAEIEQAISPLVLASFNTKLDLPPLRTLDHVVHLPAKTLSAYKHFARELVLSFVPSDKRKGDRVEPKDLAQVVAANQAVLANKLLQFAAGSIYTEDPDLANMDLSFLKLPAGKGAFVTDHGSHYDVLHDAKLEALSYLVANSDGPVLTAYGYRADMCRIRDHFNKSKDLPETVFFDGSRAMLAAWNAGEIPHLLIHPASAGHGLNFQAGGSTLVWYSLPYSLEHYLQTNGRLFRNGQTKPVTIFRILAAGTRDVEMPDLLDAKQGVQDHLLNAVSVDNNASFEDFSTKSVQSLVNSFAHLLD